MSATSQRHIAVTHAMRRDIALGLTAHLSLAFGRARKAARQAAFPGYGEIEGDLEVVGRLAYLAEWAASDLERRYPHYQLDGMELFPLYGTTRWCPKGGVFLYDLSDLLFRQLMKDPDESAPRIAARAITLLEAAE